MAKENKNVRRGVELYIDGRAVTNNIKAIEAEGRKLNKEIKGMTRGTDEYNASVRRLAQVNKILAEHRKQIKGVTEEHKSLLTRANAWLQKWGAMVASVAAGVTGIVLAYSKMRKELQEREDTKADVKALTGLDDESVEWLEQQAVRLSTTMNEAGIRVRQSATEILDAYKLVGSAKPELLGNKEALNAVTEQTLILAAASGMDLKDAVDAVTLSMNQYGAAANEAARYANVMAAGSKFGSAAVESVTAAVQKAGVAASTANVPVEQLVGAIEALAEKGIKDEVAGTGLKTFFLKLESQAKDVRPSVVGLQTALDNLAKKNLSSQEMIKMFGLEAYTVAQALVSSADKVKYYSEVVTGTATATEQAAVKSDTAAAKLAQMKNEFSELGMEIATKLQPVLSKFIGFTRSFITAIPTLLSLFAKLQTTIIALTGVALAYYLVDVKQLTMTKLKIVWNEKVLASFKKLFAVIKAHPFAALTVAAAAVIDVFRNLSRQLSEVERKQKILATAEREANAAVAEQKGEIEGLLGIARDLNKSYGERETALKKLKEINPEYFKDLDMESVMTDKVTQSVNRYIDRLLVAEKLKSLVNQRSDLEKQGRDLMKDDVSYGDAASAVFSSMLNGNLPVAGNARFGVDAGSELMKQRKDKIDRLLQDIKNTDDEIKKLREQMIKSEAEAASVVGGGGGGDGDGSDWLKKRLEQIDAEFNKKVTQLKQSYLDGQIASEDEFTVQLQRIEMERLQTKMAVRGLDEKQRSQFLDRMLDMELSVKRKIDELTKEDDKANTKAKLEALKKQYENAVYIIEQAYEDGVIPTEGRYKEYLLSLEKGYEQQRRELLQAQADERIAELKSQEEKELAQLKLMYAQRLLNEEEYNKRSIEIKKRYNGLKAEVENQSKETTAKVTAETVAIETEAADHAKKTLEQQIDDFKSIANDLAGEMSALGDQLGDALFGDDKKEAWKEFGREFLKDALSMVEKFILIKQAQVMAAAVAESATLIGAAKAIAVATAKMAAIKVAFGVAKAAVSNFYEGGFTPNGRWDQPQGVVHSNEFVANRHATANPHVMPVLRLIDAAQKSGSIANLNGQQIAAVANASSGSADNSVSPIMLSLIADVRKTIREASEAFAKPSVAYTFLNGKGGIKDAEKFDDKIRANAKLR